MRGLKGDQYEKQAGAASLGAYCLFLNPVHEYALRAELELHCGKSFNHPRRSRRVSHPIGESICLAAVRYVSEAGSPRRDELQPPMGELRIATSFAWSARFLGLPPRLHHEQIPSSSHHPNST